MLNKRQKYLDYCNELQALFLKYDLCKWKNGQCAIGNSSCCEGCNHLTETGCGTYSLACKMWVCNVIRSLRPQELLGKQFEIFRWCRKNGIPLIQRYSFEDIFQSKTIKTYTRLFYRKKYSDYIYYDKNTLTLKDKIYILWMLITRRFL